MPVWGGGGGGAYCCGGGGSWAYCCCSWDAHLPAWRRETRLDTAVAVPAMAAVRATPRMRPGMTVPVLSRSDRGGCGVGRVDGGQHGLDGDAPTGDQLAASLTHRPGEGRGPDVLVDEDARGAARFERGARLVQVPLVEQPRRGAFEDRQVQLPVAVDVADVDRVDGPVRVLGDEGEVQDADQPALDEVEQDREALPRHPAARELDHDVVDRTHQVEVVAGLLVEVVGHALLLRLGGTRPGVVTRPVVLSEPRERARRAASPAADEPPGARSRQGRLADDPTSSTSGRQDGASWARASSNRGPARSIQPRGNRPATGTCRVCQCTGTAARADTSRHAVAACFGPMCPGDRRGPHPPTGTAATSIG